jgi:hypothetical protein
MFDIKEKLKELYNFNMQFKESREEYNGTHVGGKPKPNKVRQIEAEIIAEFERLQKENEELKSNRRVFCLAAWMHKTGANFDKWCEENGI